MEARIASICPCDREADGWGEGRSHESVDRWREQPRSHQGPMVPTGAEYTDYGVFFDLSITGHQLY